MKKLIIIILILAILFALFIWPLDIFKLRLLDTFFPDTARRLTDATGIDPERARESISNAADGVSDFFSDVSDMLKK